MQDKTNPCVPISTHPLVLRAALGSSRETSALHREALTVTDDAREVERLLCMLLTCPLGILFIYKLRT